MTATYFFFSEPKIRSHRAIQICGIVTGIFSVLMVIIGTVTFPFPPDPIRAPQFFVFFPATLQDGFGYNLSWLLGLHGLGTLLLFFTLLLITFFVAVLPAGQIAVNARTLKSTAFAIAIAAGLIVGGFLSAPEPNAREYYARGLIYAFLGKYEQAALDMKNALLLTPDAGLEQRIQRTIAQLNQLIQKSRVAPK